MPRYYFNVRKGDELARDLEGMELADKDAAIAEAFLSARELIGRHLIDEEDHIAMEIEIVAEDGNQVGAVNWKDVLSRS